MTGEELLPPAFLRAMEAELAAQHEAMRASADSRIGEMIAACRDEAAAAVKKRAALCEEALERLSTRRRRLMRAVECAAQKEVEAQHLRRLGVNGAYPLGVLRRHGRDGGHAIAAQSAEGFQISLNACTAATVGACNREHAHIARHGTAWRGLKGRGRRFSTARGGAWGTR